MQHESHVHCGSKGKAGAVSSESGKTTLCNVLVMVSSNQAWEVVSEKCMVNEEGSADNTPALAYRCTPDH